MKIKIRKIIFFILTIATFVTIFIFSSQNGEDSGNLSRNVAEVIINILPFSKNLDEIQRKIIIENSQFIIRKLAHFSIYTIVGINTMGFIDTYNKLKSKKKFVIALLVGIMYAIIDEFHQMFSEGRTPAIMDVMIDSCGVAFGILIYILILKIITRNMTKN